MPPLAHLAIVACLALLGSAVDAAPKRSKVTKKQKPPVEEPEENDEEPTPDEDEADEEEVEIKKKKVTKRPTKKTKVGLKSQTRDSDEVEEEAPVKVRKRGAKGVRDWHFAIGPNVWMASVDAKVAVGEKSISTAIDFFDLQRNTKLGVPVLLEGRYKRFSFVGDILYGVVALQGGNDVGPLMVTLDGTVTNWLVDGMGGYRVLGTDASKVSLEARAGIRYQRTAIKGSLGLGDSTLPAAIVDAGADFLAGARVFVRPHRRVHFTGTVDQSLFGASTSTWSASLDANLVVSRLLVSAGWRTLTQQNNTLSTVMHGPKLALSLLF